MCPDCPFDESEIEGAGDGAAGSGDACVPNVPDGAPQRYVLSLCELSIYNTELLEIIAKQTVQSFEELAAWNDIIEVYAIKFGIPKSAKYIELVLPSTKAPSNYPHTNCKPGLVLFSFWFRQFFLYFNELESFKLTNLWPLSFHDLFHSFTVFSSILEETGECVAPHLGSMDVGFIGYHAWSDDAFELFASDIFSHVHRIDMNDRCGVWEYWHSGNASENLKYLKYLECMGNVYWDGVPATRWLADNSSDSDTDCSI